MEIKVILNNLMFKKKKPFEIPRKEIKVKVLGHIDLDTINQKTKPKKTIYEREKSNLKKAEESLNRDYNGIVNFLEFYQLCDLRDSLNKYIALYQRLETQSVKNIIGE